LVIMLHNLLIANYALRHLGSVHDAFAFKSTCVAQHHAILLAPGHWIWADSAYPAEVWCVPPFK
ncbi:hypothetical protein BV22DRAFT_981398, partial [Leucogyrophana mollusca]